MEKTEKQQNGGKLQRLLAKWKTVEAQTRYTIVAVVAVIIVAAVMAVVLGNSYWSENTSRTVSLRLKNIGELTTQSCSYTNVQVLRNSRQVLGVTVPFTQSHYIYSYDGEIKAGIDFADVTLNVDEAKKRVIIGMPPVKIFSNEIDQDSLTIYDESKNIFTPLKLNNLNDSLAQLKVESEETAIGNGLLENAWANAETLVTGFLAPVYDPAVYTYEFVQIEDAEE